MPPDAFLISIQVHKYVSDFENSKMHILLVYFVGHIPTEAVIKAWDKEAWGPHGWIYMAILSFFKGYFQFAFAEESHCHEVISHDPWMCQNVLVVCCKWHEDSLSKKPLKINVCFG